MSSLLEFLQKERKLNWKFWFRYYHQHLLSWIYNKNKKEDDSWKGVKIAKTEFPDNFPEDLKLTYLMNGMRNSEKYEPNNIFKYLGEECKKEKIIMKRFKD